MELFRLRKSKYTYVIFCVLLFMILFGTIIDGTKGSNDSVNNKTQKNSVKLYVDDYDENYNVEYSNKYEMLISSFSGNIVPMALMIFSGLFAGAYRRYKFDKNIIGLVGKRRRLIYANAIICGLYNLVIMIMVLGMSYIGYMLFYSGFNDILLGDTGKFFGYIVTYYLLLFSVSLIMACFVYIIRNQIAAIIIGLIYGSGIVYGIFDFISASVGMKSVSVKTYLPLGNIYGLSMSTAKTYSYSILIAVIFCVLALVVNVLFYNNEDIMS